jgi:YD repeat-containing protein
MPATQTLLFTSADGATLFSTDGSAVTELPGFAANGFGPDPNYYSFGATVVGSTMYFAASDATGATSAIWSYNGTSLTQITSSQDYVFNQPDPNAAGTSSPMASYGGDLVFSQASLASNASGDGAFDTATLALYNATTGVITQPTMPNGGYDPTDFVTLNGTLYFEATDNTTGSQAIYSYDGTSVTEIYNADPQYLNTVYGENEPAAGTVQGPLVAFNGNLYFGSGQQTVYELDSTASLSNSATNVAGSAEYQNGTLGGLDLFVSNNHLFYLSENNGIFSLDDENDLTQVLSSIGAQSFTPVSYNGQVYFTAYGLNAAMTQLVPNLYSTTGGAATIVIPNIAPSDFLTFGSLVYDNLNVPGLSTFNGSAVGTVTLPGGITGAPLAVAPFAATSFGISVATYLTNETAYAQRGLSVAITDTEANVIANHAALLTQIELGDVSSLTRTNITGQSYTSQETIYDAAGAPTAEVYSGVTGEPYSAFEYDYSSGNFIASKFFYTAITSEPYTADEYDYDGAGRLTGIAFTGVTGTGYSSYEQDFVGGVFAGSSFTYATVPTGATYTSYETNYSNAGAFTGDQFFYDNLTGQTYAGEEEDFGANGKLARVVLTGVTDQAYSSLEEDYSAGTYEGYKAYYTGITGETYANEEVDVSASNQIEKVVYSGMTSTPYS